MAKSKAEIQKAYRERKKLREGEAYLKKERERIKAYYVPIDKKLQRKAEERRQKVHEWVRQHRLKNKNKSKTVTSNMEQSAEVSSSSSDVTSTMKLPKLATKKRTRTRVNRANTKHRRTIADLSGKN